MSQIIKLSIIVLPLFHREADDVRVGERGELSVRLLRQVSCRSPLLLFYL